MTYQNLWDLTYKKLKESLPDHAINTWFEPVTVLNLNSTVSGCLLVGALPDCAGFQVSFWTYVLLDAPKKSNAFVNFLVKKKSADCPDNFGPPYSLTLNIDEINPANFNATSGTTGLGPMDITLVSFEPDPLSGFTATQNGSDGI